MKPSTSTSNGQPPTLTVVASSALCGTSCSKHPLLPFYTTIAHHYILMFTNCILMSCKPFQLCHTSFTVTLSYSFLSHVSLYTSCERSTDRNVLDICLSVVNSSAVLLLIISNLSYSHSNEPLSNQISLCTVKRKEQVCVCVRVCVC